MMTLKTEHQRRVEKFMELAGQTVRQSPSMPTEDERRLRAKLILEEAMETVTALGFIIEPYMYHDRTRNLQRDGYDLHPNGGPDLVEIADGCADISVVTMGTLSACGIPDKHLLDLIDNSNLSKFSHVCPKCGHEEDEPTPAINLGNPNARVKPLPGMVRCAACKAEYRTGYRRQDGKWIKPESWEAPDIDGFFKGVSS
jgi:predicted HAD superfamily Cof-like phosphohydrolase